MNAAPEHCPYCPHEYPAGRLATADEIDTHLAHCPGSDVEDFEEEFGEPCDHECFDNCDENVAEGGYYCHHEHCWNCGGCGCPGYCDDYQTYNLRPAETGGTE